MQGDGPVVFGVDEGTPQYTVNRTRMRVRSVNGTPAIARV
ncbi:hypothetical protein ASZ90_011274 [hydrocarbon metagenome]|uniref:Uncharacterized protein n=1 Tax=hydrocarbon metagenome TaxID=938273 RepID=A0A0W8FDT0_9ZZZZ